MISMFIPDDIFISYGGQFINKSREYRTISASDKTSYRKVSRDLEIAILDCRFDNTVAEASVRLQSDAVILTTTIRASKITIST